jgi:dihydropteroate synthase
MHTWQIRGRVLTIERRPLVMGIVNVTPDSFSDGGRFSSAPGAVEHALALVSEGADILDIGGESTRPGSQPVSVDEELHRVLPVVEGLAGRTDRPLSIDTSKPEVARACLAVGAASVNDVTARGDSRMVAVVREAGAGALIMHMQGTPATMQQAPHYADVVREVFQFLETRLHELETAGIAREQIAIDPGIGFGKTGNHNLQLLGRLEEFGRLGRPVCLGVSRKGFLSSTLGQRPVERRLGSSLAAVLCPHARGAVQIVRVHDVEQTRDALVLFEAIEAARKK